MIAKLESAGLGFSTNSSQVLQRLGKFEIMQQMNQLKKHVFDLQWTNFLGQNLFCLGVFQ